METAAPARVSGRADLRGRAPPVSAPDRGRGSGLDAVRMVFWHTWRHLFPPHALAAQTPTGAVLISWSLLGDPAACRPHAAPIVLRFEPELVDVMRGASLHQRVRIARTHEGLLREGLRGYDPYSRFGSARVVVIG